ncbi:hypothetical protein D3C77_455440 [compost metagenome]
MHHALRTGCPRCSLRPWQLNVSRLAVKCQRLFEYGPQFTTVKSVGLSVKTRPIVPSGRITEYIRHPDKRNLLTIEFLRIQIIFCCVFKSFSQSVIVQGIQIRTLIVSDDADFTHVSDA